ncbi:MAG: hypothetical protein WCK27_04050 [Verrucomicrobiota bacterium]
MLIPTGEIQHAKSFRFNWHVPPGLRAAPWYRSGLRILEDGKALPLRVENAETVEGEGMGRFGAAPFSVGAEQKEYLWLSASDNTDPRANGRKYEFQIDRPSWRLVTLSAVFLALALGIGLVAGRTRIWSGLLRGAAMHGAGRLCLIRSLAGCFAVLALLSLAQVWEPFRVLGRATLPAAALVHESGGDVSWRLPRWVLRDHAVEVAYLFEGGILMKRVGTWAWQSEATNGSYYCSQGHPGRICFRTTDGSNPSSNDRRYTLKVSLLPVVIASPLAGILGIISLLLFNFGPELTKARLREPRFQRYQGTMHCVGDWFQKSGWRWIMLAVGLAKLWVVADAEILAQPNDAAIYAHSAIHLVWGADDLACLPSGFPMLAGLLGKFGIPWRLALELLYLAACASLAAAVADQIRSRLIAVCLFIAMVWHPYTLSGFREFMAYPVLLLLSAALLAIMFRLLAQPTTKWGWRAFFSLGIVLFLWGWVRTEEPLVWATYALFMAFAWMLIYQEPTPQPRSPRLRLLLLPVLICLFLSTGVNLINYAKYGVYAKSLVMTSPGLTALYQALYRVKPEQEVPYAPITRQSLTAACKVSPTLRCFQEGLLKSDTVAVRYGEARTGRPGEFGPWFYNVLQNALPGDAREANEVMLAAASEINCAVREGRLPGRFARFPLDPNWRRWLPDVGTRFLDCLGGAVSTRRWKTWITTDNPEEEHRFDLAANRRAASGYSSQLLADGFLLSGNATFDSVAVRDQDG